MTRLSNYELLRVISMVLIVYHHFALHSKWNFEEELTPKKYLMFAIASWGKVGVDLFMMLTGYFLNGKGVRASSFLRTWIRVIMWSWMIFTVMCFRRPMWWNDVMEGIFPVTFFSYWFVTSYIITVLLSHGLGKMAINLTRKEYAGMLTVMFYTLSISSYSFSYVYSDVLWFMFLFLIGSFFHLHQSLFAKISTQVLIWCLVWAVAVNLLSIYWVCTVKYQWAEDHGGPNFLMIHSYAPLALIISVLVFLLVGRLEFRSKIVNIAASVTFGIYLIHDNRLIRPLLWDWINASQYYDHPAFYQIVLVIPALVFVVCGFAEWVRQLLLGRFEQWLSERGEYVVTCAGNYVSSALNLDDNSPIHFPGTPGVV